MGRESPETKIVWGEHSYKGKAEVVAKEIKSLGNEVKPHDILEYAKSHPKSELHKCFTWDDSIAAEKWRLHEARLIVCNLKVVYVTQDLPKTEFRLMQRNETTGGYKDTVQMTTNADEYAKLLMMAKAEAYAFERKFKTLTELEGVFDEIDKL